MAVSFSTAFQKAILTVILLQDQKLKMVSVFAQLLTPEHNASNASLEVNKLQNHIKRTNTLTVTCLIMKHSVMVTVFTPSQKPVSVIVYTLVKTVNFV